MPSSTTPPTSTTPLESLQRDGFVIIPSFLSPTDPKFETLYKAAKEATRLARTGKWPYFRTVPKQFPPWPTTTPPPASEGGIWGVQHLLHPDLAGREEFAKFYFSDDVLGVVEELLLPGTESGNGNNTTATSKKKNTNNSDNDDEPLVMELFNLLVAPETKDFQLRWHRDDIPSTVSPEEELNQLLSKSATSDGPGRQSHAQYNLALCEDDSLIVIPGSHRRVRTEIERAADPYEPSLPGQIVVKLQPGDAVFYDSNIVHRGVYRAKPEGGEETRLTVHGSVGLKDKATTTAGEEGQSQSKARARQVLQHGVGPWGRREDAGFSRIAGIGERAEKMRGNLVAMGSGDGIGFSLDG